MKKLFIASLVLATLVSQYSFAASIAQTMQEHMIQVLDKSGDPKNGVIDIEKLDANIKASVAEVDAMPVSSEKTILGSANQTLVSVEGAIKNGQYGAEQIKGFYANLKDTRGE